MNLTDLRYFPSFDENLEWNLVFRGSFSVQRTDRGYFPLPPQLFEVNSHLLIVGVSSTKVKPSWYLGCWAEQRLLFRPSSTTVFPHQVKTRTHRCQLGVLTLCPFDKLQSPWLLQVRFPWWLEEAQLEIWRYDGVDQTLFEFLGATTTNI